MDKKKLRNDIILIASLLVAALVALIIVLLNKTNKNLVANVYVRNEIVLRIDLDKSNDQHFEVDGINGKVHIHVKDGAIAIVESNCPHQDCVHMGYVSETNRPIICAYNQVSIVIEGGLESNTVVVG